MKKRNLIIIFLITAVLLTSLSFTGCGESDDYRQGVVYLQSDYHGVGSTSGSAFAIGDPGEPVEYLVTCAHCVEYKLEDGSYISPDSVTVWFNGATNDFMIATVVMKNTEKDLAILKLPEKTTKRRALKLRELTTDNYNYNEEFTAIGFPSYSSEFDDNFFGSIDNMVATSGTITNIKSIDSVKSLLMGFTTSHGNSGGPVIDKEGYVVGVVYIRTYVDEDISGYAISIDELYDLASPTKYGYITKETEGFFDDPDNLLLVIIPASLLVIILIVIIIIVSTNGKKRSAPAVAHAVVNNAGGGQVYGGNGSMGNPMGNTIPLEQQPGGAARGMLACLTGNLSGRSSPINGRLVIGRDNTCCNIVYPQNEPGISGKHCSIEPTDGGFMLTDLRSSFGTFLANGTKLNPGESVRLVSGDKFYLAAPENMFVVR